MLFNFLLCLSCQFLKHIMGNFIVKKSDFYKKKNVKKKLYDFLVFIFLEFGNNLIFDHQLKVYCYDSDFHIFGVQRVCPFTKLTLKNNSIRSTIHMLA